LPNNDLLIIGELSDSAVFGRITLKVAGKQVFTAKMDNKGNFVWVSTISVDTEASLNLIGTDQDGTIYIGGTFSGSLLAGEKKVSSNGRKDIFLARIDPKGIIEDLFSFGGEGDEMLQAMEIDNSGNIFLTGSYSQPFEVKGSKLIMGLTYNKSNSFISKFYENFKPLWVNRIEGEDYCEISSLKLDQHSNVLIAGSFNSRIHINDTILTSNGYSDIMFLKYSSAGMLMSIKSFGSRFYDYSSSLNIDNLGGAIITGTLGDTLIIDSLRIEPSYDSNSAFLIQFSAKDKVIWGDCTSGNGRSFSTGSILDKEGNLYYTGSFVNEFRKDNDILTPVGDQDIFLAKYTNCDFRQIEILGEPSFCQGKSTEISIKRSYSSVVWNDTIKNKYKITVDKPGINWVTAIDNRGCNVHDTVNIVQNADPIFSLGQDTTVSVTDSLILKAPYRLSVEKWQDFSTDREYIARSLNGNTGEVIYWLRARDSVNCYYTDTISINYIKDKFSDIDKASITVHPNPTRNRTWWSMNTKLVHNFTLEVINEQGVKVIHQQIKNYMPDEKKEIDMGGLPSGVYYLQVTFSPATGGKKSVRILKN